MQTAPGIPEAVARTDKSVPRQGHYYYPDNTARYQVTLRRAAPRPAHPPLVPERQSFRRRNGPGGIRTLTCDLDRVLCCHYTTSPRTRAYFSQDRAFGVLAAFIEPEVSFWDMAGKSLHTKAASLPKFLHPQTAAAGPQFDPWFEATAC